MSRPTPPSCKTGNWPAQNAALKRRGSLAIWFDSAMTWVAAPTGKRGRQPAWGDAAIQTCRTMKVLFGMALRQTTGFVESLLRLIGLDWAVPDFSTLSRRQSEMGPWPQCGRVGPSNTESQHPLPRFGRPLAPSGRHRAMGTPLVRVTMARGIKVEGEGEWNARKHGGTKRPSQWFFEPVTKPWLDWRKIHIGIDAMEEDQETVQWTVSRRRLEIRTAEVTTSDVVRPEQVPCY
jgi:hypothetical protein